MSVELDNAIRTSLLAFSMKAYAQLHPGSHLEPHPYARYVTSYLERVAKGEVKRLCVALPPRHGKTYLASIAFSAWLLAHDPSNKILLVSYGQELADKIAYDIRAILQSDWLPGVQNEDCKKSQQAYGLRHHRRRRRTFGFG